MTLLDGSLGATGCQGLSCMYVSLRGWGYWIERWYVLCIGCSGFVSCFNFNAGSAVGGRGFLSSWFFVSGILFGPGITLYFTENTWVLGMVG